MPRNGAGGNARRNYQSPQRDAQARETRARILAAASDEFVRHGFAVTTLRSIAGSANVSVSSIELAFGTKAALLKTTIDVAIAGDDAPVAVLDRPWAIEAVSAREPRQFLSAVAATLRPAMERSAGLVVAAYAAAPSDPVLAALAQQLAEQRATVVAWIVDELRKRSTLRTGLTRRRAIDEVWLLMEPAAYQRMHDYRGWTAGHYEKWFVDATCRLLLPG